MQNVSGVNVQSPTVDDKLTNQNAKIKINQPASCVFGSFNRKSNENDLSADSTGNETSTTIVTEVSTQFAQFAFQIRPRK